MESTKSKWKPCTVMLRVVSGKLVQEPRRAFWNPARPVVEVDEDEAAGHALLRGLSRECFPPGKWITVQMDSVLGYNGRGEPIPVEDYDTGAREVPLAWVDVGE